MVGEIARVTGLVPQKRNPERVNVFLDDAFAFSLTLAEAAALHIGQSLTPQETAALRAADDVERAKQSAYRFLSYRPRSTSEVRQHILKKGYDDRVADRVVERLEDLKLLDDRAFAEYWVEQRETFRPRSRMALRHELYQKGLAREIVDESVSAVDEEAAARRAAAKKAAACAGLPKEQFLTRLGQFLRRRGFDYAIVSTVSHELWEQVADDAEES